MDSKRKVIGMGETIMDILFRDGQPRAAVYGGSSFNCIVSVGRAGVPCTFVGDTGADIVGRQTLDFMRANHIDTTHCLMRPDVKSAVSLAYLNAQGDASYVFYKPKPEVPQQWTLPQVYEGDVLVYGSYYSVCPGMRPLVQAMLQRASEGNAIIYYDINFRAGHVQERDMLMPHIQDNCRRSTIVRGSADDFEVLYGERDAQVIYDRYICDLCSTFICTSGADAVTVCMPHDTLRLAVPPVQDIVSTVGAGDNFNAGFACSLVWQGINQDALPLLGREQWQRILATACAFSGDACRSFDNYISTEFGAQSLKSSSLTSPLTMA